jgi:choline dehydrogenase-like flavoprotein
VVYEQDVLIVGAGPTGLTLAIDLARRGVKVRIVDAASAPFRGSRGKGIQPRTQEIWKLAWALRGGPASILDSYESERLPVAAAVLNLSRKLHVSRSMKRGALTNQLGLHHRESPLTSGTPLGELHPGDRMPDGRLANGRRIFDVLRHEGATQWVRQDGFKVLVRPDAYIASIGWDDIDTYAGQPVVKAAL